MSRGFGGPSDSNALMTIAAEIRNLMETRSGVEYSIEPTTNSQTDFNEETQRPQSPSYIPDPTLPSNRTYIPAPSSICLQEGNPQPPTRPTQPPLHPTAETNRH